MNEGGHEAAEVLGGEGGRRATLIDVRADVLGDVEQEIERARPALEAHFQRALGEREGPGFVRYRSGDGYGAHRDSGTSADWPAVQRRAVSVVLFLSGCEGGMLRLFLEDGALDVAPEPGLLVAFRSDLLHEVLAVTAGVRDVVVDWFYGPTSDSSLDR